MAQNFQTDPEKYCIYISFLRSIFSSLFTSSGSSFLPASHSTSLCTYVYLYMYLYMCYTPHTRGICGMQVVQVSFIQTQTWRETKDYIAPSSSQFPFTSFVPHLLRLLLAIFYVYTRNTFNSMQYRTNMYSACTQVIDHTLSLFICTVIIIIKIIKISRQIFRIILQLLNFIFHTKIHALYFLK